MRKLSIDEMKTIYGGGHYHWFCSVNRYLSNPYSKAADAAYKAGVHAATYNHSRYVTPYQHCTGTV